MKSPKLGWQIFPQREVELLKVAIDSTSNLEDAVHNDLCFIP